MSKKINEKVLAISPRQALIKRLNVYFGAELGDESRPFSSQKSVLVREITDNAVDILRKLGKGGNIKVTFFKDKSIEVQDSGSGIPIETSQTHDGVKASSLYLALGVLNAGTNYENASNSIGTNGVGGSGTQMLSEYMKVEVYRNNKIYRLDFKEGVPGIFDDKGNFEEITDLAYLKVEKDNRSKEEKESFPTGTKIRFKIDDKLFKSQYDYEVDYILDILKGISFLDSSIRFHIVNHLVDSEPEEHIYHFGGGLENIVDLQASTKFTSLSKVAGKDTFQDKVVDVTNGNARVVKVTKDIVAEAVFAYNNDYEYRPTSFVNALKTRANGVHTQAFEESFTKVFNQKLTSMRGYLSKNEKQLPMFQDYSEGLVLAVSVELPEPEFTHQTKESLGGKETLKSLRKIFAEQLENWIEERKNQDTVKAIADKVIEAYKLRLKRTEEIDLKREKNKLERSSKMPEKLVDCEDVYTDDSELYLCEGDSALSPLLSARNSKNQAIYPLKGKSLNVFKASTKEILQNKTIQDIIRCLDAGIEDSFDYDKLRYKKVIIAADQDPDGYQITNLLIALVWKLFPEIIYKGGLYKVQTPLYIVRSGKKEQYAINAEERDEIVKKLKKENKKYEIVRAKGLAETGIDALEITGMNKDTRRSLQITVEDVEKAKEMLEIVMGDEVEPRKEWLRQNPYVVEEVDFE